MTRDEAIRKVRELCVLSQDANAPAATRRHAANGVNELVYAHCLTLTDFDEPGHISLAETVPFLQRIDDGWDGEGMSPSQLYEAGVDLFGALFGAAATRKFQRNAIDIARRRWREGFYPDPFTKEPRRRVGLVAKREAA